MPAKQSKPIRISEHYRAERTVLKNSHITRVMWWGSNEQRYGHQHIQVTATEGLNDTFDGVVWKPADVNWLALGSVTAEEAAEFAKALAWAAREAKRIDRKTGVLKKEQ